MANKEELKSMVLQFKVADLQLLLGFAGQNKIGRKTELQKKALNLINNKMSIPLEMKIRQMYRDIIPENNAPKPNNNGYCLPQSYQDKYDNYYTNGSSRQSASNLSYEPSSLPNYYTNSYNIDNYYESYWPSLNYPNYSHNGRESLTPKVTSHAPSFNIKMPSNQNLSNVTFKKLPFYKFKSDILSVTPLMPKKQHGDSYEFTHSFSLSQDQLALLNYSKKNDEYRYQVQLRMCLLNEETEVSDDLPLALTVKVNDKNCQLPPAIPSTNKQGMLLKRMNAPINLSSQTSKKNCVNNVFISWSVTCDRLYGIGISLVKKFTADELIDKLKVNGERDAEVTKKYLSEKLGQQDDDIAATSLKVSMICPLGKILMSLPVRATTCNHLQCFDGSLYIKMNDVKSTWQCPVCNQPCYYDDLFIDGYFVNVLKNNTSSRMSEIQIEADGSVTPVVPKKRSSTDSNSSNDSNPSLRKKIKLEKPEPSSTENPDPFINPLSSSSSSFSSDYISISSSKTPTLPASISQPCYDSGASDTLDVENQAQKSVVLVDLTESDSEIEDQPLNLKKYKDRPETKPESCSSSSCAEVVTKISPPVYDIDLD
ncbi:E3 SUMO-protein ligase PIAS1-like [Planococcus citri]|uniref:E3 SUMO-protein ligase PIAS1-like n=1 Tax=Planococcus citri TaxID=170843 RepID=UPI0031F81C9F